MSDIGPRDFVQAVVSEEDDLVSVTAGAIYQVHHLCPPEQPCEVCGDNGPGLILVGQADEGSETGGWCHCAFRKWPPPADASLICEEIDTPEMEPA